MLKYKNVKITGLEVLTGPKGSSDGSKSLRNLLKTTLSLSVGRAFFTISSKVDMLLKDKNQNAPFQPSKSEVYYILHT